MARTPLVLYTFSAGRFGNQLLRFFHWAAWVRELDGACFVLHLPFWPYARLFSEWNDRPACVITGHAKSGRATPGPTWIDPLARLAAALPGDKWDVNWKLQRIALRAARNLGGVGVDLLDKPVDEIVDLEDPTFLARARDARYLVCAGWEFGCWNWLERHAAHVRGLLKPQPVYGDIASAYISELRTRYDVLIGLFIRRGDYRTFFDGRFYHDWSDYGRWARQAIDLQGGKNAAIVIAGDDSIPLERFSGLPVEIATGSVNRGGHWMESFLELAACDIILGPPSTFAACAAFYGDKPWLPLRDARQNLGEGQILDRPLFQGARDPEIALSVR